MKTIFLIALAFAITTIQAHASSPDCFNVNSEHYIPGNFIIKFKKSARPQEVSGALEALERAAFRVSRNPGGRPMSFMILDGTSLLADAGAQLRALRALNILFSQRKSILEYAECIPQRRLL